MAGALGDLFAPAYIASDPNSVQAVQAWQDRNYPMTNALVEQTRTPVPFNTGNPAGEVDPQALQSLAQGGPYDFNARRNAIAAQVQANAQQTPSAAGPKYLPGGGLDPSDPGNIALYYKLMFPGSNAAMMSLAGPLGAGGGQQPMSGGPYSGGGPPAPGLLPPQVGLGVS